MRENQQNYVDHNEMMIGYIMSDICDLALGGQLDMLLTGLKLYHEEAYAELLDAIESIAHGA